MHISDCKRIFYQNKEIKKIMHQGSVIWQKIEDNPCKNACQSCQTSCELYGQCGLCQTRQSCGRRQSIDTE